jgi:hypothetical protein
VLAGGGNSDVVARRALVVFVVVSVVGTMASTKCFSFQRVEQLA